MEMPGHNVRVVLHHGEHDLVAGADVLEPEARGDEIDRLRSRAGEDDLVARLGVEEAPHALARGFVGLGGGIGQIMQAAMDVGVFVLVGVDHPLDHRARLLRRSGVVEINERLAVGPLRQDGKVGSDRFHVVWRRGRRVNRHDRLPRPRRASQSRISASSASASSASATRLIASAPNASSSIASASTGGRPRACR